jgi:preprotein translocase subunit SecE
MSSKEQNSTANSAGFDSLLLILALLVAAAGIVGYHYFADLATVLRVLIVLGAGLVATGLFYVTAKGQLTKAYLKDTRTEVKKVKWPTRQETLRMTLIVFVAVVLIGLYLWLADMLFSWLVGLLTGR